MELKFFLILIYWTLVKSMNFFNDIYSIPMQSLNDSRITTSLTNPQDFSICNCDLKQNICDYLCCCDPDCPVSIISQWTNSSSTICKNTGSTSVSSFSYCFNRNILYNFNVKRGMKQYTDTTTKLFCINLDDNSQSSFQPGLSLVNNTMNLSTSISTYVNYTSYPNFLFYLQNNILFNNFYQNLNTTVPFNYDIAYPVLQNSTSTILANSVFRIPVTGAYGECNNVGGVPYGMPIKEFSCGFTLNSLSNCLNYGYENLFKKNFLQTQFYGIGSNVTIKIRNIQIKNMQTGLLKSVGLTGYNTTLSNIGGGICSCNNLLLDIDYYFIEYPNFNQISNAIVDLVLADSVTGPCQSAKFISRKFSYTFSNNISILRSSGNPGYEYHSNLLILSTLQGSPLQFINGYLIQGRDNAGICIFGANNDFYYNNYDQILRFGENKIYSCWMNMNITTFQNFCTSQSWKNLTLFNNANQIKSIGIFGSANITNANDWVNIINNFSLNDSSLIGNTCNFPNTIVFDIEISTAGSVANPQNYVVGGRLTTKNRNYTFVNNNGNSTINLTMNFIVNFVDLNTELMNQALPNPSILPKLPKDIANPFIRSDI